MLEFSRLWGVAWCHPLPTMPSSARQVRWGRGEKNHLHRNPVPPAAIPLPVALLHALRAFPFCPLFPLHHHSPCAPQRTAGRSRAACPGSFAWWDGCETAKGSQRPAKPANKLKAAQLRRDCSCCLLGSKYPSLGSKYPGTYCHFRDPEL